MVDGRSAIRDRNRTAVLDAVLDLFSENNLSPGPEEVALRAGLSARSVYRYFNDRDGLTRAAIARNIERVGPRFRLSAIGEGSQSERIERFVAARLTLVAEVGPTFRAGRARATFDPLVAEDLHGARRFLFEQVARHFAPELEAMDPSRASARALAIDALFSLESLDGYLHDHALSCAEATPLLADALHALLCT